MARDAYPLLGHDERQEYAADAFLQGCREKLPVYMVMDRAPATLQQALELVRRSSERKEAIFGGVSNNKLRPLELEGETLPQVRQVRVAQCPCAQGQGHACGSGEGKLVGKPDVPRDRRCQGTVNSLVMNLKVSR